LDALMTRVLSRNPEDRFRSAQEMLKAWRTLGAPTLAPRPTLRTEPERTLSPTTTQRATTFRAGASGLVVAVAAGLVALVATGVLVVRARASSAKAEVAVSSAPEPVPAPPGSLPAPLPLPASAVPSDPATVASAPPSAAVLEELDAPAPTKGQKSHGKRWTPPPRPSATAKAAGTSPYQISPKPRY
jgi:hypothetical protein